LFKLLLFSSKLFDRQEDEQTKEEELFSAEQEDEEKLFSEEAEEEE